MLNDRLLPAWRKAMRCMKAKVEAKVGGKNLKIHSFVISTCTCITCATLRHLVLLVLHRLYNILAQKVPMRERGNY